MNYLNRRYDTDEKRGWFIWSIFFGLIFGTVAVYAPAMRDTVILSFAALLILIGARFLIVGLLDRMYGVNQDA